MDFLSLVTELFTNADHFLVTLATEYGLFMPPCSLFSFWKPALW